MKNYAAVRYTNTDTWTDPVQQLLDRVWRTVLQSNQNKSPDGDNLMARHFSDNFDGWKSAANRSGDVYG